MKEMSGGVRTDLSTMFWEDLYKTIRENTECEKPQTEQEWEYERDVRKGIITVEDNRGNR